ncbi:MAG: hypothetical protein ACK56K_16190, partial [Akkermansiaceae bacterium]
MYCQNTLQREIHPPARANNSLPEDRRSAPPNTPLRAGTRAARRRVHVSCAGECCISVRVPPARRTLPPPTVPRAIPSAAVPAAVTSPLRHAAPAP